MTTKTRFTSSRIVLLSLTASLFSMTAQADLLGVSPLAIPTNLNLNQTLITNDASPGLFETGLGNVGQAIDNVIPLKIKDRTQYLGEQVDIVLDIKELQRLERRLADAVDLGVAFDSDLAEITLNTAQDGIDILGSLIENANLPLNAGQAAGTLLHGVSDTVGSARGLLYNDPNNPYPISSTLHNLTGSLAATTDALLHGGNQLQPLLGAQTTALNNNAGLLAPVTNLVSSVTGGLGGDSANSQGLLAPITGLLGNGLLSPPAAITETPPDNTVAATNAGLLAPVTNLLSGLLGNPR